MDSKQPAFCAMVDNPEASTWCVFPGLRSVSVGAAFWARMGYEPPPELGSWGQWKLLVHRKDRRALLQLLCGMRRSLPSAIRLDLRLRSSAGRWLWTRIVGRRQDPGTDPDCAPLYAGLLLDINRTRELDQRFHALFDRPFQFIGLLTRDGSITTTDFTLTPLLDEDGLVTLIIPEGRDITPVVQAREALRIAENRLTIATRCANLGLWDWNPQTDAAWFNDQFFVMLGYQPGELEYTGSTLVDLAHPEDRARVDAQMHALLELTTMELGMECRMRRKDGDWRWFLAVGRVVEHSDDGRPIRVAGVHMDITERKELEMQLASAQRLESIGQLAAGLAHEINTPIQFVHDSLHFVEEAAGVLLQSRTGVDSGTTGDADARGVDYCRTHLPAALERAQEGLGRVADIVRSMRDFSHADDAQMAPFDLNRAVRGSLVVARHEYRQVADAVCQLGEIPQIVCHGGQINQVLLNLIVNAAHAIRDVVEQNGERGRITIGTSRDGDDVVISVSDTGTGVPESIRHRLFEPFFTTKPVGKGTGQGLAMSRNIVKRHHGALSFSTTSGVGTTFHVRLPLDGRGVAAHKEVA